MQDIPLHITLEENIRGRDFFLGDLHGMMDSLNKALDKVHFDPSADRIISVGDIVDRGPDSVKACALLNKDWFFAVRGNHEEMFLASGPADRLFHINNGGQWTENENDECLALLRSQIKQMPLAITVRGPNHSLIGICHAEWPKKDWSKIDKYIHKQRVQASMLWGRTRLRKGKAQIDKSANLLVHGHTPIDEPKRLGDALFIDTGCVYGGTLTLIEAGEALDYRRS